MLNTLTSDSAAEDLSDHSEKPWLELSFAEPGLYLTDQGLEMTSAWPFPIGSTLSVGITCPASLEPGLAEDLGLLNSLAEESELAPAPSTAPAQATGKAAVQATGIVISCEPSAKEGKYLLTIYFLDHLANLIQYQEQAACDFVDEPSAAGLLPPHPQKLIPGKTATGPAADLFGLAPGDSANAALTLGVLPFFLGA